MNSLFSPELWLTFLILTSLEITLSGDNIIFLLTTTARLPGKQQASARKIGLLLAMMSRILLLTLVFSASKLTQPLFYLFAYGISIRAMILILGGMFLFINSLIELRSLKQHNKLIAKNTNTNINTNTNKQYRSYYLVIMQIMCIDIVFSIDSVITAIGVSQNYYIMISAIIIATVFMLIASNYLAKLLQKYPHLKVLGLCFLILVALVLLLRGFGFTVNNGFIYVPFVFMIFTQCMLAYAHTTPK